MGRLNSNTLNKISPSPNRGNTMIGNQISHNTGTLKSIPSLKEGGQ